MDSNGNDVDSSEQSNSEESDDENTELVEESNEIVERIVQLIQDQKLSACQLEVLSAALGKSLQGKVQYMKAPNKQKDLIKIFKTQLKLVVQT